MSKPTKKRDYKTESARRRVNEKKKTMSGYVGLLPPLELSIVRAHLITSLLGVTDAPEVVKCASGLEIPGDQYKHICQQLASDFINIKLPNNG